MKLSTPTATQNSADAVVAGKHGAPLITDERLLHLHAALLRATSSKPAKAKAAATPAIRFPAVYASLLADLTPHDRIAADIPLHIAPFTAVTPLELTPDIATGLAIGLAQNQPDSLVIAFTRANRLQQDAFQRTLRAAAHHHAPILYVLLPAPSDFDWSAKALRENVPCIPVDTHDAVALYRVAQETILRARNHGGPSLIDCKQVQLARGDSNPVSRMEAHLRRKGLLHAAHSKASSKSTSATSRLA
jgi:hypothetical protein